MSDTIYKLIYFKPFDSYEILDEFDTEEEAEARKAELLKRAPQIWLSVARVPRPAAPNADGIDAG